MVMVEVMKNGKIVYRGKNTKEAWGYIDKQPDKDTEKYTIIDYR